MGYVLLWIECLAGSLLLVALLLAMIGRLRRRWWRGFLAIATAAVPLTVFAGLTCLAWFAQYSWRITDRWFWPLLMLTLCCLVGTVVLWCRGLRQAVEPATAAAAGWPRCRLATWLGGVFVAVLATVWIINIQIQQRLLALQAEARALALSVTPPTIPDAENAALLYAEAAEALDVAYQATWPPAYREKWSMIWWDPDSSECKIDDPDLGTFLRQHSPTLTLIREAASLPDCYFDRAYYHRPGYDTTHHDTWILHNISALLALSARWNAKEGDVAATIADINALLGLGEHVSNEPTAFCVSLTASIDRWGYDSLHDLFAKRTVSSEELGSIRLSQRAPYATLTQRTMRMQEAVGLGTFYDIGSRNATTVLCYTHGLAGYHQRLLETAYPFVLMEDDIRSFREFCNMHRWWANSFRKVPDPSRPEHFRIHSIPDDMKAGLVTRFFAVNTAIEIELCKTADARRRVARAALAAAKYQAEERELPETLDELVPDFLLAVPFDPFDGKPLKMKRTVRGIVIYSIGSDGTDDGGQPLDETEKTGDITFELPDRKQPAI